MGRDQFSAERGILSPAAEFAHFRGNCFHGILQSSVLGTDTAYFDGVQATVLYVYMISP